MKTRQRPSSPAETLAAAQLEVRQSARRASLRRVKESIARLREAEKKWRAQRLERDMKAGLDCTAFVASILKLPTGEHMKNLFLSAVIGALLISTAQAGIIGVVKHVAVDAYHVVKHEVLDAAHAVKHVGGDAKTVAK